jgi:hypothetical protein
MELSGVSMSINGVMCGMKSVGGHEITFVVPEGLNSALTGTAYPFVVNNNGVEIKRVDRDRAFEAGHFHYLASSGSGRSSRSAKRDEPRSYNRTFYRHHDKGEGRS